MRNFFVNLTNPSNNRETSAPIPVTEQNSANQTNDHPSSSYESDVSTSPPSHYTASPTLNTTAGTTTPNDSSPPSNSSVFIKHFVFSPGCHIRIDYRGKLRNEQLFESGPLLNLLIGLAQLAKVDIYLKRISYKRGLKGYEKLLTFLLEEWLSDIRPTDVIKGIVPLSSISQIAVGIRDLFYLPIYQYRRDGRVMHGLQRGASSFTTSTALALIELSGQVVRCAHFAALLCFELVSSTGDSPSNGSLTSSSQAIMVRNHPPPNDIREGVTYAMNVIQRSFNTTSHQLRTEAQSGRRRNGLLGVIGALLRQMPSVAIQPIVTTTKAADNVLVGLRNHFNPDERNDDKEKYRNEKK
jgi:autophagy-related protein 2